jgi:hypothetical protein
LTTLVGVPDRSKSVHHARHREAARFQESPNQQARENETGDVEPVVQSGPLPLPHFDTSGDCPALVIELDDDCPINAVAIGRIITGGDVHIAQFMKT